MYFRADFLTIYDGDSDSYPELGRYCGNSVPPSHISSNNTIFIHFKTDGGATRNGFKLEYKPYSK